MLMGLQLINPEIIAGMTLMTGHTLAILLVFYLIFSGKNEVRFSPMVFCLLLIPVVMLFNSFRAYNPYDSFGVSIIYFLFFAGVILSGQKIPGDAHGRARTSLFFMTVLGVLVFCGSATACQSISLVENTNSYTIENEYYKAIIVKPNNRAKGLVKYLYVKKQNGQWSQNLVFLSSGDYALGYLEGTGLASENCSVGMQQSPNLTVTVLENSSTRIKIRANGTYKGTDFTEIWTFWAKKPYFQSEASAVVEDENGFLTNEFQFCWMINNNLNMNWYGTDKDGNIVQFSASKIQQIHSSNLNTYPWVNWQFPNEGVSLGLIFTDTYDHYGTIAETGDWNFEYQVDFELGSGVLCNPVKNGHRRELTTIYYTTDLATNDDICNFATNRYQYASTNVEQNPILQAAQYINNPYYQNPGLGSALVSSPYFLVRQNTQNNYGSIQRPQYETSIYAPLYKNREGTRMGNSQSPLDDQLVYSLSYSNGSTTFKYGIIDDVNASNSDNETSLRMHATSSDNKLQYNSILKTWDDSDKLKIEGIASDANTSALVKDIYVSLKIQDAHYFEAEDSTPTEYITPDFVADDGLWTYFSYYYWDSEFSLIYRDNSEEVPVLEIPINLPDGEYHLKARVKGSSIRDLTYHYSLDNVVWHSFVAPKAEVSEQCTLYIKDLGIVPITNGKFYINDDDSVSGVSDWLAWDAVVLSNVERLSSNVYDVRILDDAYGKIGIAVKINSPTGNISVINDSEIRIYLYQEDTAQELTDFNYPFDIEIFPHTGWLNDASEFTDLHSRDVLTYTKHALYVPEGIHTGRTNTVYSDGAVTYSTEPYNDSSEVNMTISPSENSVDVTIDTWSTSDTYYKKWTESAAGTIATSNSVGDLKANTYYPVKVDGVLLNTYLSDDFGKISFIYANEYLDHVFEVGLPIVNFADFAFFANHWMDICVDPNWCDGCDFNESGQVDLVDFAFFVNHWMDTCVDPDWCDGCDLIR